MCEPKAQLIFTDLRSKDVTKKNVILKTIFGLESLFRSQVPFSGVFNRGELAEAAFSMKEFQQAHFFV